MRGIVNSVKQFAMAVVAAFGASSKNNIATNTVDGIGYKKTHIKKKIPFSSERQHARYRRQIANGQITKSNGLII